MKQFFNRNKILIGSLVFLAVYSLTLVTFATPPGSQYSPGETLDPACVPGGSNCSVDISTGIAIGDSITGSTPGSVLFIDPSTALLNEDTSNFFFYDNTSGTLYSNNLVSYNLSFQGESSNSGIINFSTERLHSYGTSNEFWGASAGNFTLTGTNNIGFGTNAGLALTTGSGNVCIGQQTCQVLTTGGSNIFIGKKVGEAHTSGDRNILIGFDLESPTSTTASDTLNIGSVIYGILNSGYIGINDSTPSFALDVTGTIAATTQYNIGANFFGTQDTVLSNVRLGSGSGTLITSGTANILLGINSGTAITTSSNNTIIGTNAGISLSTSSGSNVFIGDQAGYSQTTGYENTFIGQIAGRANLSGQRSVAIGNSAAYQGTSSDRYVAIGYGALGSQISAADNVAIGYSAGILSTGGTNVYIGSSGGYLMTSAQYNVMLGYATDLVDKTDSNNFVVGSSYAPIYDVYIGQGDFNGSPSSVNYHGTGGVGTNITGGSMSFKSGQGTGTGSAGDYIFYKAVPGSTGTSLNTQTETFRIGGNTGIISRDGGLYSVAGNLTTTTWGALAGAASSGSNTASVFIGYGAGFNSTAAGAVIINGDTNNFSFATTYGNNTIAIGNGALASSTAGFNVAYGVGAGQVTTTGTGNVYLGYLADYLLSDTSINNRTGSNNIAIGQYGYVGGNFSSVFSAQGLPTASNQIVFGGGNAAGFYTDAYLGNGVVNASPQNFTYNATGGSGTNIAGATITIAGGKATGSNTGGSIIFKTSDVGASGATLQSLTTKATLLSTGNFGIGVSPTARLHVKGPDTSVSTSAFLVTNSTPTTLFEIKDDGTFALGAGANAGSSPTNTTIGTSATNNGVYGIAIGWGASASTNSITIGSYSTTSNSTAGAAIGLLAQSTTWGAWMIGGHYNTAAINDINGSLKFASTTSASSDNNQSLFVAGTANQVFDINTDIRASNYSTHYDFLAENTITTAEAAIASGTGTVTSVASGISSRAVFTLSSPITGIADYDQVVISGFTQYTNGTYYIVRLTSTTVTLHSTRNNAYAGSGYISYTNTDTGIITPQRRTPAQLLTDAIQYYANDITAGQASPHWLTEDGAIIGLGSGKFGLRSNHDLNLTANDVVGATLKASNNFFGIGDTTPDYLLDVENTGTDGDIFAIHDSDGECLHNPEAGSETVTCSSDERLKTNIADASPMLPYLDAFHIRQYDVLASNDHLTGVIAQEVQALYPDLVTISENGYLSVASPNIWQIIKAIQELDVKVEGLTDLLTENNSVAEVIRTFLANSTNKITRIFTGEICLNEEGYESECINREQLRSLKQLLQNQDGTSGTTSTSGTTGGNTSSTGDSTSTTGDGGTGDTPSDTTPPTITLIGDSTITLSVGDTYIEQGAQAQDDTDGEITANIQITNNIDTQTPGTYTVRYTIIDSSANQSEITREVVVG